MKSFLAIDIGASSGRHILGTFKNGRLALEEIYRFDNGYKISGGSLVWDVASLEKEVIAGIIRCGELGHKPQSISIDTWGVDYVLLDENCEVLSPVYCYRDGRTEQAVKETEEIVPASEMYLKTGIQKQNFNTVYQLWCDKKSDKLSKAKHFLMMPDFLIYRLTGNMFNEYTNATTASMVKAGTAEWDFDLIDRLGYPKDIFLPLSLPCTQAGALLPEIAQKAGFNAKVVLCGSHDTASAVAACPLKERGVYISSGTWSLMGTELMKPTLTEASRKANFTNEGGIEMRYRFLKNYMGMWLLQNIRRDLDKKYSYDEMMEMAERSTGEIRYIDVNSPLLTAPENMIEAVRECASCPDMPLDEVLNCVYHSLARSYCDALSEIEEMTGIKVTGINIVGGGCCDGYLNRLTAKYTGLPVYAGPKEATATGNLIVQLMAEDTSVTLEKAREIVYESFGTQEVRA